MIYSFKTDKGSIRELNEDAYAYSTTKNGLFCVAIADGMGGHNCGEIASRLAADETIKYLSELDNISEENVQHILTNSIRMANEIIIDKSNESKERQGMGTTIVLLCAINNKVYIEHVGDSRAYLIRDDELTQLTKDHSYIEELVKIGYLNREEAEKHPRKNVITKALGSFEGCEPDFKEVLVMDNDIILLCTDGLTNMISNDEFADVVSKIKAPDRLCEKLVKLALKNGGKDNVTVAAIKF